MNHFLYADFFFKKCVYHNQPDYCMYYFHAISVVLDWNNIPHNRLNNCNNHCTNRNN